MGRRQVITRDRVADVALDILDREGLDALSLDRIASEMGVRGPSLYYYFSDKTDILRAMTVRVLGDLDLGRDPSDWREWMIGVGNEFYRRVRGHPNAASLLVQYMPPGGNLGGFERATQILSAAGVDSSLHVLLMEGSQKIVWGYTLQRAVAAVNGDSSTDRLADRFPHLLAARNANRWSEEELLEVSLRAFIDGVVAAHDITPPQPPPKTRKGRSR